MDDSRMTVQQDTWLSLHWRRSRDAQQVWVWRPVALKMRSSERLNDESR